MGLRLRKVECIVQACICDKRHRLHLKTARFCHQCPCHGSKCFEQRSLSAPVLKKKLRLQGWGLGLVGIGPSRPGQESPSLCPHPPQWKRSPSMMAFLVVPSVCSHTQFNQGKNDWIQELSKTAGFTTDTQRRTMGRGDLSSL